MADIAMCPGEGCPVKDSCYRHTAPQGFRQGWINFAASLDGKDCTRYWPDKKKAKEQSSE